MNRTLNDASAKNPSEQPLRYRRETLEALLESAAQGVIAIDEDGQILLVNSMSEKLFGYARDDLIGHSLEMLLPKRYRGAHAQHRANYVAEPRSRAMGVGNELTGRRQDGTEFPVEIALSFANVNSRTISLALITDVSERKRREEERIGLEHQLRQSQKLEALAVLSGGIAHDFNNILGAISNFTAAAMAGVDEDSNVGEYLRQVLLAVERASALTKGLLSYSRPEENQQQILVDVALAVQESLELLKGAIPSSVKVCGNVETSCGMVDAVPSQVHQIVMNLGTNAYQAMSRGGGTLAVTVEPVNLTSSSIRHDMPPGRYVKLAVSDTGTGIPAEIIDKVFDPFFTTKESQGGSGLGLSVVQRIVKSLGGTIDVESVPNSQTTFFVYLPRIDSPAAVPDTTSPVFGCECILMVDDEPMLAASTRALLEQLGYEVVSCTSSVEALALFCHEPQRFDVVLTDLTMPDLSGTELAMKIRQRRADVSIVLSTGFRGAVDDDLIEAAGIGPVLHKPYTLASLSDAIQTALARPIGKGVRPLC